MDKLIEVLSGVLLLVGLIAMGVLMAIVIAELVKGLLA